MTDATSMRNDRAARFAEFDANTEYGMFIGDEVVAAQSGQTFRMYDTFEEAEWGYVPVAAAPDVDRAVRAARAAFQTWSKTPAAARSQILAQWAALVREHAEELARLQVHENGKTITEMRGSTQGVAAMGDYAAQLIHTLHGQTITPMVPDHDVWTRREPVGVVAAITPGTTRWSCCLGS